jgi:hypothetical protein
MLKIYHNYNFNFGHELSPHFCGDYTSNCFRNFRCIPNAHKEIVYFKIAYSYTHIFNSFKIIINIYRIGTLLQLWLY